jgi:DNA-binding NarL/FixJ family response regulator
MPTDTLKEIAATRAKLADLEAEHAQELEMQLAALPGKYGFANTRSFIKAVKAATKTKGGSGRKSRAPRTVLTDEIRAGVKKLVADGKTGDQIAEALGISRPSVQNIKKSLGLVAGRKA